MFPCWMRNIVLPVFTLLLVVLANPKSSSGQSVEALDPRMIVPRFKDAIFISQDLVSDLYPEMFIGMLCTRIVEDSVPRITPSGRQFLKPNVSVPRVPVRDELLFSGYVSEGKSVEIGITGLLGFKAESNEVVMVTVRRVANCAIADTESLLDWDRAQTYVSGLETKPLVNPDYFLVSGVSVITVTQEKYKRGDVGGEVALKAIQIKGKSYYQTNLFREDRLVSLGQPLPVNVAKVAAKIKTISDAELSKAFEGVEATSLGPTEFYLRLRIAGIPVASDRWKAAAGDIVGPEGVLLDRDATEILAGTMHRLPGTDSTRPLM